LDIVSPLTARAIGGGGPLALNALYRTIGNAAVGQLLRRSSGIDVPARRTSARSMPIVTVQRLLKGQAFASQYQPVSDRDGTAETVKVILDEFHAAVSDAPLVKAWESSASAAKRRQRMLTALSQLNGTVYNWFNRYRSLNLKAVPSSTLMFKLLDEAQDEHQKLIGEIAETGTEHPISAGDAPEAERNRALVIWQALLRNQGNIRITEHPQFKGFRTEALAAFANLLQSQAGRDLVESLQQDPTRPGGVAGSQAGRRVNIEPVASTGSFAASHQDLHSTHHLLGKKDQNAEVEHPESFTQVTSAKNLTEQWRRLPGTTGMLLGTGAGSRRYEFGVGQGSNVAFPVGSRARSHGMKIDARGNQILSPSFVSLGHELYHAQHNLQGTAFTSEQAATATDKENMRLLAQTSDQDPAEYPLYENTEEYLTIAHNENYLREQYGLSLRATHTVQCMFLAGRLDDYLQENKADIDDHQRKYVENLQNALQREGWLETKRPLLPYKPDLKEPIKETEEALSELLNQLQLRDIGEVLTRVQALLNG
jgi:hypothetical protein